MFLCAIALNKCWCLLRDIPANKVLSSTATSIRACQLEWASVSLIAHSLLQMRRKSPLFPRSGVVACARAMPRTRCFNNVSGGRVHQISKWHWVFSVRAENNWEVCVEQIVKWCCDRRTNASQRRTNVTQRHTNVTQGRTIVTQKYNNRTNGKWGDARATNKSKPHWSTCFLLNTLESGK